MIEKITLKFGSSRNKPKLEIDVKPLTIFVGPNNSGKSVVLRDIVSFCGNGAIQGPIIESITLIPVQDIEKEIRKHTLKPVENENINEGFTIIFGKRGARNHLNLETLKNLFSNPNINTQQFSEWFLRYNVIPLDGANRLQMINAEERGDLKNPTSKLSVLFTDDFKRSEARRIIFDAFNKYFTLDPFSGGQLLIKLSDVEPSPQLERSLADEALEYHRNNLPIESMSDGVKVYCTPLRQIG